jgi:hypothetical protein
LKRFFPWLNRAFDAFPEARDPERIVYPARSLLWSGVLMFCFHLGARRRLRFDLNGPGALANLGRLCGVALETLPHGDTLVYSLKRLDPSHLAGVVSSMARALLRSRALERWRLLNKYYLVAMDGSECLEFRQRHCEACRTQDLGNGETRYSHPVLSAMLLCENGLVVPLVTEFLENRDGQTKQDCESKAFARALPRLRRAFARTVVCLLLDGLYLGSPTFRLCREERCVWIATFKRGSAPAAYAEWLALVELAPDNVVAATLEDGTLRRFRWVNGIDIQGETVNVFECQETPPDGETKTFVWATCLNVHEGNVEELAMKGGRLRWKIENEGFKTLKRDGYGMEHVYSEDWNAARNFYYLMQIAFLLVQLVHRSNLFETPVRRLFGSVRAFVGRMLEAWRNWPLDRDALEKTLNAGYQIRLDTS